MVEQRRLTKWKMMSSSFSWMCAELFRVDSFDSIWHFESVSLLSFLRSSSTHNAALHIGFFHFAHQPNKKIIKLSNLNSQLAIGSRARAPSTTHHHHYSVKFPKHSIEILLMRRQRTVSVALALVTHWFGVFSVFCLHVRSHHHRRITPRDSAFQSFFFHGFAFSVVGRRLSTTRRDDCDLKWEWSVCIAGISTSIACLIVLSPRFDALNHVATHQPINS